MRLLPCHAFKQNNVKGNFFFLGGEVGFKNCSPQFTSKSMLEAKDCELIFQHKEWQS